jgi:hypothetical protein
MLLCGGRADSCAFGGGSSLRKDDGKGMVLCGRRRLVKGKGVENGEELEDGEGQGLGMDRAVNVKFADR